MLGTPLMRHNPHQRRSLMIAHPRPLIAVFAAMPDLRKPRGQHHPLTAHLRVGVLCDVMWRAKL
jgi:hypothetical protein